MGPEPSSVLGGVSWRRVGVVWRWRMGVWKHARAVVDRLTGVGAWELGQVGGEQRGGADLRESQNPGDPSASNYSSSPTQEDQYWGNASSTEEDYWYRRLSDNWYQKDVVPSTYLEIHNQCYESYNANPLANYIIEITTNFVLGNGISISAKNKRVQKVIDGFWDDPDNHMATRVYDLCTELSLYGEQFIRFFVNPYSGRVTIRQIDPSMIDQIETDPEDIETVIKVHRRPQGPGQNVWSSNYGNVSVTGGNTTGAAPAGSGSTATGLRDPAANSYSPSTPAGNGAGGYDADATAGEWLDVPTEVIHVAINKVSNAKRGKSDLATLLPWLRRYKDWLTDRVRINKYKGAFLWTIRLTGADRKTIDRKRMEYSYPPEPGSIVVHNESEEWSAVQPSINADDVQADGRAIKMMIAMGAGLPEHYLSEGGSVNYATAAEMGLPTFRKFQRRQDQFVLLIRRIVNRVLDEATAAGALPAGADRTYTVVVPELAPDDNSTMATAAQAMVTALTTARQQGWISDESAMSVLYAAANLGIDVTEELTKIESDRVKDKERAAAGEMVAGQPAPVGSDGPGLRAVSERGTASLTADKGAA